MYRTSAIVKINTFHEVWFLVFDVSNTKNLAFETVVPILTYLPFILILQILKFY